MTRIVLESVVAFNLLLHLAELSRNRRIREALSLTGGWATHHSYHWELVLSEGIDVPLIADYIRIGHRFPRVAQRYADLLVSSLLVPGTSGWNRETPHKFALADVQALQTAVSAYIHSASVGPNSIAIY